MIKPPLRVKVSTSDRRWAQARGVAKSSGTNVNYAPMYHVPIPITEYEFVTFGPKKAEMIRFTLDAPAPRDLARGLTLMLPVSYIVDGE